MPETNVTSRSQAIIEVLRGDPAGRIVEIDQHIAAEHNIEVTVMRHVLHVDQVRAGEFDRISQAHVDAVSVGWRRREIPIDQIPREPHQGAIAVDAVGGGVERTGIDVRTDDLDVVFVDLLPVFHQPHGDGIRFLAGRAWDRPNAERFSGPLPANDLV